MSENNHITPHFENLSRALDDLARALLNLNLPDEAAILGALVGTSNARSSETFHGEEGRLIAQPNPKCTVVKDGIMDGASNYSFELVTSSGLIGLTILIGTDDAPEGKRWHLEIVPVYVYRNGELLWFHQAITPIMEYQLMRHAIEIAYRLERQDETVDPNHKRLAAYRKILVEQHGLSDEDFDQVVSAFPTPALAIAHFRTTINTHVGAHVKSSRLFEQPNPETYKSQSDKEE